MTTSSKRTFPAALAVAVAIVTALLVAAGILALPAHGATNGLLAFMRSDRIYVMNPDGTGEKRLQKAPSGQPDWSPDGQRIAFVSNRDGGHDIYVTEVKTR